MFVSLSKHEARVLNFKDKYFHTKPLLTEMNTLNVYETNLFQILCFMFNCKTGITPSVFSDIYTSKSANKYPLRSIGTLPNPYYRRKYSGFIKRFCGPHIWNKILLKKPLYSRNSVAFVI